MAHRAPKTSNLEARPLDHLERAKRGTLRFDLMWREQLNWKTTAHLSNDHVDASNYGVLSNWTRWFSSCVWIHADRPQSIYNLQFGGQTITPSGSGNKGYFDDLQPVQGFDRVSWAAEAHILHRHERGHRRINESSVRSRRRSRANSGYFQNFEGNTNCTTNPYVVEYNLSVASISTGLGELWWKWNYSSISHRNSTLSGTTFSL